MGILTHRIMHLRLHDGVFMMAVQEARITIAEAMKTLLERIVYNPETFAKAIGGKRIMTALVALLKYVRSEGVLNRVVEVTPQDIEELKKMYEELKSVAKQEHWVVKL